MGNNLEWWRRHPHMRRNSLHVLERAAGTFDSSMVGPGVHTRFRACRPHRLSRLRSCHTAGEANEDMLKVPNEPDNDASI